MIKLVFSSFQVAIADHDGVLTCFGMKKGEAVVSDFWQDLTTPHISQHLFLTVQEQNNTQVSSTARF